MHDIGGPFVLGQAEPRAASGPDQPGRASAAHKGGPELGPPEKREHAPSACARPIPHAKPGPHPFTCLDSVLDHTGVPLESG